MLTSLAPVRKMEVGFLQKLAVPIPSPVEREWLAKSALYHCRIGISHVMSDETSRYYAGPFVSQPAEKNYAVPNIFEIPDEDVQFLIDNSQVLDNESEDDPDNDEGNEQRRDKKYSDDPIMNNLTTVSLMFGVAFGRFDLKWILRRHELQSNFDPFMRPPSPPDIVVDDDINIFEDILKQLVLTKSPHKPATHEVISLQAEGGLLDLMRREFFKFHLSKYTKNRRKSPIYWQLATPSASYSVWLYIHAFTKDTLYRVQNDYAAPKLAHEERAPRIADE